MAVAPKQGGGPPHDADAARGEASKLIASLNTSGSLQTTVALGEAVECFFRDHGDVTKYVENKLFDLDEILARAEQVSSEKDERQ